MKPAIILAALLMTACNVATPADDCVLPPHTLLVGFSPSMSYESSSAAQEAIQEINVTYGRAVLAQSAFRITDIGIGFGTGSELDETQWHDLLLAKLCGQPIEE